MTTSPGHKIRIGRLQATIWRNVCDKGNWNTAKLPRNFKVDDGWRKTDNLGQDELLAAANLLDLAHTWTMCHAKLGEDAKPGEYGPDIVELRDRSGVDSTHTVQSIVLVLPNGDEIGIYHVWIVRRPTFIETLGVTFRFENDDGVFEVLITGLRTQDCSKSIIAGLFAKANRLGAVAGLRCQDGTWRRIEEGTGSRPYDAGTGRGRGRHRPSSPEFARK